MPVTIGASIPEPDEPVSDLVPDYVADTPPPIRVIIAMEDLDDWSNFDQLPVEEQERLKARYRFMGIRLRHDIKDRTIPLTKETLDIP